MKQLTIFTTVVLMACATLAVAKEGKEKPNSNHPHFHVRVTMPDCKDTMAYLGHYYGKGGTVFLQDSAKIKKGGVAEFNCHDTMFVGGSFILLLSDKRTNFEFLLNPGDDFSVTAKISELPEGIKFNNSPENVRFQDYQKYTREFGGKQQVLVKQLAEAKTAADTAAIRKTATEQSKELSNYRANYIKQYPNSLLANILNAIEKPTVPEGDHFLPDGKTKDSTFAYHYYKNHFWDGFNFQDDRLIYTPLYDQMLEEYFNKMILPYPDSVEHEADMLLKKAHGSRDVFHYTLWWVTRYVENSKVMGLSDAFVYLVENYYMKGEAFWLTTDELQKYIERSQKMAPNVIGNIAPEIRVPNIYTKKEESMLTMHAKYTLVVFYSPTCGHCQHELPALDSAYEAVLKDKGVRIFTVATEGDEKAITDFLTKIKVDKKWTNCWDPNHEGDWRGKYDVYSTPTIYLLDEKKLIQGKRLDHANIAGLIDMVERKAKDKAKNGKN